MILDAETLALSPGVQALVDWAEGHELPGVLKMELLASMVELATGVCETAHEALEAMAALRAGAAEAAQRERARAGRGRDARVQPADCAADRAGPALPRVRQVRGSLGAAPGGVRPARPRRDAELRGLHGRARGGARLAPSRARPLGELAVPRRRGDRPDVEPSRGPGGAATRVGAAGLRLVCGVGGVRRALRAARPRRRLHALLVGHPPAPALRDARDPRAGPADLRRADRRVRGAAAGALRDGRGGPPHSPLGAATTPRTAGPRFASGRAPS